MLARLRARNGVRRAEFKYAKPALARYQEIPRLQVAVHHAALVGALQARAQLPDDLHRLLSFHRRRAHTGNHIAQQFPFEEFLR